MARALGAQAADYGVRECAGRVARACCAAGKDLLVGRARVEGEGEGEGGNATALSSRGGRKILRAMSVRLSDASQDGMPRRSRGNSSRPSLPLGDDDGGGGALARAPLPRVTDRDTDEVESRRSAQAAGLSAEQVHDRL